MGPRRNLIVASLAAVAAIILILDCASAGWFGLSLRAEVRPIEAISLVTTLLIAFFLQRFFTTRINDLRAEKNVLIGVANDVVRILNEVRELVEAWHLKPPDTGKDAQATLSGFRRLANAITELEDCVEMSQIKSAKETLRTLRSGYYELKASATGDPFPAKSYTTEQRSAQHRQFRTLTTGFRSLIFQINRSQE